MINARLEVTWNGKHLICLTLKPSTIINTIITISIVFGQIQCSWLWNPPRSNIIIISFWTLCSSWISRNLNGIRVVGECWQIGKEEEKAFAEKLDKTAIFTAAHTLQPLVLGNFSLGSRCSLRCNIFEEKKHFKIISKFWKTFSCVDTDVQMSSRRRGIDFKQKLIPSSCIVGRPGWPKKAGNEKKSWTHFLQ